MSTLYRDYRPQNFADVFGQNHIKISLQNEIAAGRPASAYLFCGPRAVGKTTMARILAKALNCEKRQDNSFEPCNDCPACRSITSGSNLDIVEIDAASNTGVDNVRENIISFSRLAPASSKYKVFIIDEVHMLSVSAFNALLKIIEEPPTYVIFILCTTEIQKVPSTVISRCERYDFKRISVSEVVKKLSFIAKQEKISVDGEVLEAIARRSGGHLRDAESLLGQIISLGDKNISREQAELVIPSYNSHEAVSLLEFLSKKDAGKAIGVINSVADSGGNMKAFVTEIISLLRKLLIDQAEPGLSDRLGLGLGESLEKRLLELGRQFSSNQLIVFTEKFLTAAGDNRSLAIPQLPLELAVIDLCQDEVKITTQMPRQINQVSTSSSVNNSEPQSQVRQNNSSPAIKVISNDAIPAASSQGKMAIPDLDREAVLARWPEVLVKIKNRNHSLSFVLQSSEPRGISSNRLGLAFKYKFHLDRLNNPSIKPIVEGVLKEVYGGDVDIQAFIDEGLVIRTSSESPSDNVLENSSEDSPPATGLVADLLDNFGGQIVA
jgi:DNA polymerase-3 subunit gamma/tau